MTGGGGAVGSNCRCGGGGWCNCIAGGGCWHVSVTEEAVPVKAGCGGGASKREMCPGGG